MKTAILRVLSKKIKYIKGSNLQPSAVLGKIVIEIFALFSLAIDSSLRDHICFFVLLEHN